MKNIENSAVFNLQMFLSLLNPGDAKKDRIADLRIIIALGKLTLFHEKIEWEETYPSRKTIAKWAGIKSEGTVSRFVNSPDFLLFGEIKHQRKGRRSNTYNLHPHVLEIIQIFKTYGLLTDFDRHPKKWLKNFKSKVEKWLIPLSSECSTVKDLMNKLSTKNRAKKHASTTPKRTLSLPTESLNPTTYIQTKPAPHCCSVFIHEKFEDALKSIEGIQLSESDSYHFLFKESLSLTSMCAKQLSSRMKCGWRPRSPVKALQALINTEKNRRKENGVHRRQSL